jgi:hypothetical protein
MKPIGYCKYCGSKLIEKDLSRHYYRFSDGEKMTLYKTYYKCPKFNLLNFWKHDSFQSPS